MTDIDIDAEAISRSIDDAGYAVIPRVLTAAQCRDLIGGFDDDSRYRSTIDMRRHGFGSGVYRYFDDPLPDVVHTLRKELYALLAPIAGDWAARLGDRTTYPPTLDGFLDRCHTNGQRRPTPLVFRYQSGDFNALHQDVYGTIGFPLQGAIVLDRPGEDFTGGELLLVTQIPRRQSVGEVVVSGRGQVVVFPNARRPMRGTRGWYAANVRHGVSRIRSGTRHTLGIILHDAT